MEFNGLRGQRLSKYLTQTLMSHGNEMICQPVTLSGYAEWPKVADAVIEAVPSASGAVPTTTVVGARLQALAPSPICRCRAWTSRASGVGKSAGSMCPSYRRSGVRLNVSASTITFWNRCGRVWAPDYAGEDPRALVVSTGSHAGVWKTGSWRQMRDCTPLWRHRSTKGVRKTLSDYMVYRGNTEGAFPDILSSRCVPSVSGAVPARRLQGPSAGEAVLNDQRQRLPPA